MVHGGTSVCVDKQGAPAPQKGDPAVVAEQDKGNDTNRKGTSKGVNLFDPAATISRFLTRRFGIVVIHPRALHSAPRAPPLFSAHVESPALWVALSIHRHRLMADAGLRWNAQGGLAFVALLASTEGYEVVKALLEKEVRVVLASSCGLACQPTPR